jgi:hypothetical protein
MNYCVEDGERSLLRKFHSRVIRGRDEFRNHSCTLAAQPSLASAQPRENQTHELTTNQMLGPSVAHPVVGSEKQISCFGIIPTEGGIFDPTVFK